MRGGRSRPLGHASSRGSAERVAAKALDVLEGVASAVHHDVGGDALRVERHERAGRRTERVAFHEGVVDCGPSGSSTGPFHEGVVDRGPSRAL